ncbi:MAG TPA: DUF559 domain-containing protein [Archangium sp.]
MRWVKRSTARARKLRRSSTGFELDLWPHLRNGRMLGRKFRRQHPIGPFFADFACVEAMLVVELDGAGHDPVKDAERAAYLSRAGWRVLRLGNDVVASTLHAVLETIAAAIDPNAGGITPHPNPLPRWGERE